MLTKWLGTPFDALLIDEKVIAQLLWQETSEDLRTILGS